MQIFRSGRGRAAVVFSLLAVSAIADHALAVDYFWTGTTGPWTTPGNWDSGFVPEAQFEEVGVIGADDAGATQNGGIATLSTAAADAAGVVLGQDAGTSGTLRILSGGSINFIDSNGEPTGAANIGLAGTGVLEVQGGGAMSTALVDMNAGSMLEIGGGAGAASVTSTDGIWLAGRTITHGAGHTFTAATFVNFEAGSEYVVDLTSGTHTTLTAGGNIGGVQGPLIVQTSGGYTPSLGTTWDILDGQAIGGNFVIDASGAPAVAPGTAYATRVVPGGNGQVMQLVLDAFATLTVNTNTGAMSIASESGAPIDMVGYSIVSAGGQLNPANWNSLTDQNTPGWQEAGGTVNSLNELNAEGGLTLNSTSIGLGSGAYVPPTEFGVSPDVTFQYAVDGDLVPTNGIVKLTGSSAVNNLLLTVDPSTGEGQLKNSSAFTIDVLAYSITSATGSLDDANWTSLDSQAVAGWDEASSDEFSLNELVPEDPAATLNPGEAYSLGNMFQVGGSRDLQLEFALSLVGGNQIRQGIVQYGEIPGGVEGDYNGNGVVDAADYTVWRDNLGGASLTNEGAGISPGVVDSADYAFWKSRFGATSGAGTGAWAASAPVPEPSTVASAMSILLAMAGVYRRQRALCRA